MKFSHTYDPYATHQPVLCEAIKRTTGSVVELGCGFGSTELIHELGEDRLKLSIEHDKEWLSRFLHLQNNNHIFTHINHWSDILSVVKDSFKDTIHSISVLFVDQGDWQSRANCIEHFKHDVQLAILHDSDYLERELGVNFGSMFEYVKTFMPLEPYPYFTGPPTTIMSNYVDVTTWEIDYRNYA